MKVYRQNQKIKGYCSSCDKQTIGTLKRQAYEYKGHIIPNVLQLFCNECGKYMGKPYSSSKLVSEKIKTEKVK